MSVTFIEEYVDMVGFPIQFDQVSQIHNGREWLCEVYREIKTGKFFIEVKNGDIQQFYSFDKTLSMGHILTKIIKQQFNIDKWLFTTSFEEEFQKSDAFQIDIREYVY